ncbi:MAG TPA: nitronate monooxygenase [Pseudonocardia sp.]|jgi:nitronate monooxygenase
MKPDRGVEEPKAGRTVRGLRLPVVAAPMLLISGVDLVVSACSAGVVGAFPAPNCRTTDELDQWMGTINDLLQARKATGRRVAPWAVNMVTHRSNQRLADDLSLLASHRPPVVITALGSPAPVMEVVKDCGGLVIAEVVDLRLARKAVPLGVDGLACVSAGAGGHTGKLSPFAFVAAVREVFDGLVVVGGGIST